MVAAHMYMCIYYCVFLLVCSPSLTHSLYVKPPFCPVPFSPILNCLSIGDILGATTVDAAVALYGKIPEPQNSVLRWMVELMSKVVLNEDINKMSTKNCAIVMGPNLYQYEGPSGEDPMQALMVIPQKLFLYFN
jgi:hypothetical protein